MSVKRRPCPSDPVVSNLLDSLIPGRSTVVKQLRKEVKEFALNPSANSVLLRGPIGAGKSTVARMISYARRLAPLSFDSAKEKTRDLRTDELNLIEVKQMEWYVEMPLTGLSHDLATVQLFGCVKGAYTGAVEGPGIFERAQSGRTKSLKDATPGATVTGGVVFIDEIGDLSRELQAKLLPVLAGGIFHRVGGEGDPQYEFTYRGLTIAATWHGDLSHRIRPDLWSRITTHVIDVPGLADRADDMEGILDNQIVIIVKQRENMVKEWRKGDPEVDGEFWHTHGSSPRELDEAERDFLLSVDWSSRSNLRGLTQVLQILLFSDISVREAVRRFPPPRDHDPTMQFHPAELYRRLLNRRPDGSGLAAHIGEVQREERAAFRDFLRQDPSACDQLCTTLGIDPTIFKSQVDQLGRTRRRANSEVHQ